MSGKRVAVPVLPASDPTLRAFASAVKGNLDALTGQQDGAQKLAPLPASATLADVIAAVNIIIGRLGS